MKYLNNFLLFESVQEAQSLMVLPTNNLNTNYSNIVKCINLTLKGLSNGKELNGKDLMLEIAMVETYLGTIANTVRTTGNGGKGIWQIDKIAFTDVTDIKNHPQMKKYLELAKRNLGIDLLNLNWEDCNKLLVGCVVARLSMILRNFNPNDTSRKERAKQWKKYYNTFAGKGTVERYWNVVKNCLKQLKITDPYKDLSYAVADKPTYNNRLENPIIHSDSMDDNIGQSTIKIDNGIKSW